MRPVDYFLQPGPVQASMRELLEREATVRAPRFGVARRDFLGGAMGALAASALLQQLPGFRSRAEAQAGFVPPGEDCYAELAAAHASRARGQLAGALDWELIQVAARAQQAAVPETVLNMLRNLSTLYGGFGVSQLLHATQSATRAVRSNASDELVLLALIHDIGEVLTGINHAEIAAALARPYVSEGGYRVVRHHMEFQLQHYGDKVLVDTTMRERYAAEPWYEDAATLSDAWDQSSFDPDYDTLPLEEFEPLVRELFGRVPEPIQRTALDCL